MLENSTQSTHGEEPTERRLFYSVLGWLGFVFLFVFILLITYYPNRPPAPDHAIIENRYERIRSLTSDQRRKSESYEVVDRSAGVVRIPVDRARDLMVERLARKATEEER